MPDVLQSAAIQRGLAIDRMRSQMKLSWNIGNTVEARWLEKCLAELEEMSDEEFADRYKDEED